MDVIFHSHHAVISDRMRQRAHGLLGRLSRRNPKLVSAIVRFEHDGPNRRVEVTLQAPRRRDLVAEGRGRTYGPALTEAVSRLRRQLDHRRRPRKGDSRRMATARRLAATA